MGNFLLADWKSMDLQELVKESAGAILSHEIDEKDYLINCIEKVSKIEREQGTNINVQYRSHTIIRPIIYKLHEKKYDEVKDMLSKASKEDIPLATSVVLVALDEYSCQYNNIEDEKELSDFKLAIIKLFCDVKNKLMLYKSEAYWSNKLNLIDNCCFQQVGNAAYIDNHRSITVYIYRLMYLYRLINNIEADYLSVIYTGNTWVKNKKYIDEIMSADEQ